MLFCLFGVLPCTVGADLIRIPFLQIAHTGAALDMVAELMAEHPAHLGAEFVLVQMTEHAAERIHP